MPSPSDMHVSSHRSPMTSSHGQERVAIIVSPTDKTVDPALKQHRVQELFDTCLQPLEGWICEPISSCLIAPERFGLADLDALIEVLDQACSQHLELCVRPLPASIIEAMATIADDLMASLAITPDTGQS